MEKNLPPPRPINNRIATVAAGIEMSFTRLAMEPFGAGWAIKHDDGFLGYAKTEAEARSLVESLAAYSAEDGSSLIDASGEPV